MQFQSQELKLLDYFAFQANSTPNNQDEVVPWWKMEILFYFCKPLNHTFDSAKPLICLMDGIYTLT
ncbi:hypothetical protein NIES4073_29620 [Kalymmatonema gypsitolerans NIES-4073]|nr:hypothetical protein NIES4073_29620 [Scytonema sp. NIES-4073]